MMKLNLNSHPRTAIKMESKPSLIADLAGWKQELSSELNREVPRQDRVEIIKALIKPIEERVNEFQTADRIQGMLMRQQKNPCGGCGSCSDCLGVERKTGLTAMDYREWRPGGLLDSLRESSDRKSPGLEGFSKYLDIVAAGVVGRGERVMPEEMHSFVPTWGEHVGHAEPEPYQGITPEEFAEFTVRQFDWELVHGDLNRKGEYPILKSERKWPATVVILDKNKKELGEVSVRLLRDFETLKVGKLNKVK